MIVSRKTNFRELRLTARESEVLTLTAIGKTRGEIATILAISDETVKAYLKRICLKFNAVNKTQAAGMAISLGMISPYNHRPFNESDNRIS